jgi:predicted naringenin-chalcone synthase
VAKEQLSIIYQWKEIIVGLISMVYAVVFLPLLSKLSFGSLSDVQHNPKLEENPSQKKIVEAEKFLSDLLSRHLGLEVIDIDTPFIQYGLKSVDAALFCGELEKFSGRKLSPTCFYEYYNIRKMSDFIVNGIDDETLQQENLSEFQAPNTSIRINNSNIEAVERRAFILGSGTSNPDYHLTQRSIPQLLLENSKALANDPEVTQKLWKIFNSSAIGSRYLTLNPSELAKLDSIADRNEYYNQFAPLIAERASRKAIENWGGDPKTITHVLSVSCTGTSVPGIEFLLIDRLNLSRTVTRLGINFMGCFGGLAGLRTAQSIALADPSHRVLLVCTELCSLQVQKDDLRSDNLVAEALFGDGAAAMIIGGSPSPSESPKLEILKASCYALKETEDRIRWDLTNTGWKVGLEHDISFLLGRSIRSFCKALISTENGEDIPKDEKPFQHFQFAIHPGGKGIIEIIEEKLELSRDQNQATWQVYEQFGNMSSATILFVLHQLSNDHNNKGKKNSNKNKFDDEEKCDEQRKKIISLAFGPGLSIEGILLQTVPE